MTCEERVVDFGSILRSLATRVPRIILQRAEEMFPALRDSMVSILFSTVNSDSIRKKYFRTNL
jgi:hypothetical protein